MEVHSFFGLFRDSCDDDYVIAIMMLEQYNENTQLHVRCSSLFNCGKMMSMMGL